MRATERFWRDICGGMSGLVTEEARELAAVFVVGRRVQHNDREAVGARATHFIRQLPACV